MTDTQRLESEYRDIAAAESEVHWLLGDKLVADVAAGYKLDDLALLCEPIFGIKRTTIRNHHRTSTIFGISKRAKEINWSVHQQAATACKLNRPDDYHLAYEWLDKAVGLTHDGLKDAMAAAKGIVHTCEPVYLCKRVPAVIADVMEFDNTVLVKLLLSLDDAVNITGNTRILLTMFIPAPVDMDNEAAA